MPAPATTTRSLVAERASRASAAAPRSWRNRRRSTRSVLSGSLISLPLEPVVAVAAPAAGELPQAGEDIGRQEEWPPLLVLPHVHVLVRARLLECRFVDAEDDVAQRHRSPGERNPPGPEQRAGEAAR